MAKKESELLRNLELILGNPNHPLAKSVFKIIEAASHSKKKFIKSQDYNQAEEFRDQEKRFYGHLSQIVFGYLLSDEGREKYPTMNQSLSEYLQDKLPKE